MPAYPYNTGGNDRFELRIYDANGMNGKGQINVYQFEFREIAERVAYSLFHYVNSVYKVQLFEIKTGKMLIQLL